MRRKQTTLLTTLAVISSLMLLSQMPAVSQVQNVHPGDTTEEPPPITDTDGDGIPDVHENLFSEGIEWITADGRVVLYLV